jgi:hypothetical protein
MKITWKEGRKSLSTEGTKEELASHIAYLDALNIDWHEVEPEKEKEVEEIVDKEDAGS